jgi:general secretion pathway protein E
MSVYESHPTRPPQSETVVALHEVGYTANDLALCSTEEARALIPFERAVMLKVLPLALVKSRGGSKLHCVSVSDSVAKQREVKFATGIEAVLTAAPTAVFEEALHSAYFGSEARLQESFNKIAVQAPEPTTTGLPKPQGDAAVFLEGLLQYGAVKGATDIHLVPAANGCVVKLRIDGELLQQREQLYGRAFHDQIVNRLKVLAALDIASRFLPQDGSFIFPVGGAERHIRVSILPAICGESVVLRLARGSAVRGLAELGIEPIALRIVREVMNEQGGLILLTGPTGSGKTTTMYSVASELDQRGRNVVTVEDPVEKRLDGPVQVQVRAQQGFSFAKAIRSVLRHDPDVVLIGEMRDSESARIGLEAASTGHLTVSSLHIASALQAVGRLETLGIPRREAVEAISLVINQRLLPRVCTACKGEFHSARTSSINQKGCRTCSGSGFYGLVLVTELLDLRSQGAKEVCFEVHIPTAAGEKLSSSDYLCWRSSLEHHLSMGAISRGQVETFLSEEF